MWYEVPENRYLEILDEIAEQAEANLAQLHTWSATWNGTLQIRRRPQPGTRSAAGSLASVQTFRWNTVVDCASSRVYTDFDGTSNIHTVDLRTKQDELTNSTGHRRTAIVTPEQFLYCDAQATLHNVASLDEASANPTGRAVYRKASEMFMKEDRWRVIDPRVFFQIAGADTGHFAKALGQALRRPPPDRQPMRERLTIRQAETPNETKDAVYQLIVRTTVAASATESATLVTEVVFDGSCAMNPTLWRRSVEGKGIDAELVTSWQRVGGVCVPATIVDTLFGTANAGNDLPTVVQTFQATTTDVNTPVDASMFDIRAFDLKYGDRFVDQIEKSEQVFDGAALVPVAGFVFESARVQRHGEQLKRTNALSSWIFVAINIAVLIAVALLWWRRHQ